MATGTNGVRTTLKLKDGETVYTDLEPSEVRQYMQGASKGAVIKGWTEDASSNLVNHIYINVAGIEYVIIS